MVVGKVSKVAEEVEKIASESLSYGLENMKPGVTFGEVVDGMDKIVFGQGYWHGFPQLYGLRPMFMVGPIYNEALPFVPSKYIGADVVVEEGMIISYKPGAISRHGIPILYSSAFMGAKANRCDRDYYQQVRQSEELGICGLLFQYFICLRRTPNDRWIYLACFGRAYCRSCVVYL